MYYFVCFHVGRQKQKAEMNAAQFQDIEDPEYQDFRTEATLQKQRQQESFEKAAEAYRQGRKDVASFYAQQVTRVCNVAATLDF